MADAGVVEPADVVVAGENEANAVLEHEEDEHDDGEDVEHVPDALATPTPRRPQRHIQPHHSRQPLTTASAAATYAASFRVMSRCPLCTGDLYVQVSSMARCPLWPGVLCVQVSSMSRCPLCPGVIYVQVSSIGWLT